MHFTLGLQAHETNHETLSQGSDPEVGGAGLYLVHELFDHDVGHGIQLLRHGLQLQQRVRLVTVPWRLIAAADLSLKGPARNPAC